MWYGSRVTANRARARPLRIPAALAFALLGCDDARPVADAGVADTGVDGTCAVFCLPDGTDVGVCPSNSFQCVAADHTCPGGCMCSTYCFPRTPEGEQNRPTTM